MAVNPILTGANGIQSALKGMSDAAQEIAELNVGSEDGTDAAPRLSGLDDMSDSLISLKIYSRQVQANAEVVKAADEMLGFLLDEFA
ncbi:MAG: flagellar biosynthesis protein FlgE [Gammaproteobacteria bacterium]|nr:flagellar biosynthesis protein FlgE [Gammaproteobacteria bacterium]